MIAMKHVIGYPRSADPCGVVSWIDGEACVLDRNHEGFHAIADAFGDAYCWFSVKAVAAEEAKR